MHEMIPDNLESRKSWTWVTWIIWINRLPNSPKITVQRERERNTQQRKSNIQKSRNFPKFPNEFFNNNTTNSTPQPPTPTPTSPSLPHPKPPKTFSLWNDVADEWIITQCVFHISVIFSLKILCKTAHSSPVRAKYWVSWMQSLAEVLPL